MLTKAESIRYMLKCKEGGQIALYCTSVLPGGNAAFHRIRSSFLGTFHTREGAKAFARIHAGGRKIVFTVASS